MESSANGKRRKSTTRKARATKKTGGETASRYPKDRAGNLAKTGRPGKGLGDDPSPADPGDCPGKVLGGKADQRHQKFLESQMQVIGELMKYHKEQAEVLEDRLNLLRAIADSQEEPEPKNPK